MSQNREPITFQHEGDKWRARIGDLEIVVDRTDGGAPGVTLHAYDHIKATPCDDEWAAGVCPDGKAVESYEDMDECGKTCPHWRDVETLCQSHAIWGDDTVAALATAARKLLRDQREPGSRTKTWDQRFARDFVERDWLVDGVLLPALREPNATSREALAELEAGEGRQFVGVDELMADLHDEK